MKTFQKNGKWTEKLQRTEVFICACGGKYIKTRPNQMTCIRCLMQTSIGKK